jgi:hypothetical protein
MSNDLLTELSKIRAEAPTISDELALKLAKFRIADALGDDDAAGEFAIELAAAHMACTSWWRWLTRPKMWLISLALIVARGAPSRRGRR